MYTFQDLLSTSIFSKLKSTVSSLFSRMNQITCCLLLLFLCTTFIHQAASSSAGSVPDDAFKRKNSRSRAHQEVAKAVLGESSANSLSPSGKKTRRSRALASSASSKLHAKAVKEEAPSTELTLAPSPRKSSGPRNAVKKEVTGSIGHARYRILKGEEPDTSGHGRTPTLAHPSHGSKQQALKLEPAHDEKSSKINLVRKHTSGELMRQIREADERKKRAKDDNAENATPPKRKSSSGSHETGKSKGLDLNLRLRRRAFDSGKPNGPSQRPELDRSTRLQLGTPHYSPSTNANNIRPIATSFHNQPSYTAQNTAHVSEHQMNVNNGRPLAVSFHNQPSPPIHQATHSSVQQRNVHNSAYMSRMQANTQVGGPVRREGFSPRVHAVIPYQTQMTHSPVGSAGVRYAHSTGVISQRERHAVASRYQSPQVNVGHVGEATHVSHPAQGQQAINRPTPVRYASSQQSHNQQHLETPISPGSQNLIDRVGHSSTTSNTQSRPNGQASRNNHDSVNLNLSLGS